MGDESDEVLITSQQSKLAGTVLRDTHLIQTCRNSQWINERNCLAFGPYSKIITVPITNLVFPSLGK